MTDLRPVYRLSAGDQIDFIINKYVLKPRKLTLEPLNSNSDYTPLNFVYFVKIKNKINISRLLDNGHMSFNDKTDLTEDDNTTLTFQFNLISL